MVLCEPYLSNPEETVLPQPWVKWAYQPAARRTFLARSCGPTRWHFSRRRSSLLVHPSRRLGQTGPGPGGRANGKSSGEPDTERLRGFADRINRAQRPVLVFGPEIDRSGAWDAGVAFAEKVGAPVYAGPLPDRASFPENHRLYRGPLPMTVAGAEETLRGHDLAIVIGAQSSATTPMWLASIAEGTDAVQICAPITIARS